MLFNKTPKTKRGRWIESEDRTNYCSNCGALMTSEVTT